MKIGLIQTRGIGDIIIELPICKWFKDRGHQVVYPIDHRWVEMFRRAAPYVEWHPVENGLEHKGEGGAKYFGDAGTIEYFVADPLRICQEAGCEKIHVLYNDMTGMHGLHTIPRPKTAYHFKYDEYKYAVAGVPFTEKWNLREAIRRDFQREYALFRRLAPESPYCVAHMRGSNWKVDLKHVKSNLPIVEIDPAQSESVFDWITLLEFATQIVCVDSCIANLVDQLRLPQQKMLFLRDRLPGTSVYGSGWTFV